MVPSSIITFSGKIGRNISVQKNYMYANELLFPLNIRWKHSNVCLKVLKVVTFTDMAV